jgi:hypothetical protein
LRDTEGLVYYLLDATRLGQRLKIGYTANLRQRLNALAAEATSRQIPLVLALETGGVAHERHLHEQFAGYRLMGEWFRYEGALLAHIRDLPNPMGWLSDRPELWRFAGGWQSFNGWQRLPEGCPDFDDSPPAKTSGRIDF